MSNKILLKNASLLTEDAQCLRGRNVYIENGKIRKIVKQSEDVQKDIEIQEDIEKEAWEVLDCSRYYVSPGLANLHCHCAMNIFKGIAEDVTADAWFNEKIWPYESRMTQEDVYVGTLLGIAEMLNNGVTVFADHYFSEEQILRAARETGIRADIAPTEFGTAPDFEERLAAACAFIDANREVSDRIAFHMGPHSNYTCTGDTLGKIVEEARKRDLPIHLHLAEEEPQVLRSKESTGLTPFEFLDRAGGFDCRVLVAHGLWIQEEDLKLLRDDTWFAFCPKTYMKLASGRGGFFDHYKELHYGFGTDGAASSNTLNPMEQARLFGLAGKFTDGDASAFSAEEIWKHLMGGHRAFSFGTGRLEEGAPADLAIWDLYQMDTFPFYSPISSILYSSNSSNVRYTMVGGEFLKYDGKLKMDVDTLMGEAVRLQKALLERGKGKAQVFY